MSITTWAATTGDWDDAKFSQAWNGPVALPAKADLTLSSSAPGGGVSRFISPDKTDLEIIQSYEWDELTTSWVTTPGTWTTGPTPQVAVGTGISPDKADLTFTAYSPESGIMYDFRITAPTLTLTGILPAAGVGFTISPENASIEIIQTYDWNNYGGTWATSSDNWDYAPFVPSAVETGQNQPDAGSLTLAGTAPSRTIQQLWYIPSGSLTLTGFLPVSTTGHIFTPSVGSLTGLDEGETWASDTSTWATVSGNWSTGTITPLVGVTYTFTIDSAGNLVFTPYDPGYPLVGQPYFIPGVIMS